MALITGACSFSIGAAVGLQKDWLEFKEKHLVNIIQTTNDKYADVLFENINHAQKFLCAESISVAAYKLANKYLTTFLSEEPFKVWETEILVSILACVLAVHLIYKTTFRFNESLVSSLNHEITIKKMREEFYQTGREQES